jgi:hypothetical protein
LVIKRGGDVPLTGFTSPNIQTQKIYISIFILWFSRKRRKLLQQNRTDSKPQALVSFKKYMPPPLPYRGHTFFE